MHSVGLIGGTFDRFHAGHLSLIQTALSECRSLEVWLTSDSRAAKKDSRINSWDIRTGEMRKALGQLAERVSTHVLDDKHGPAPTHESASAIVCTAETRLECERINQMRSNNGLDELAIIAVEHVDAWDGNPISSTRVRNGEIDREGLPWIPDSVRQGRIILTPEVEAELKEPFGQLVPGPEDDPSIAMSKVIANIEWEWGPTIAVGDVTVRALQDLDRPADIALIDGCTRREPWEGADGIDPSVYDGTLQCESPAGSLTPSLLEACGHAVSSWIEDRTTHLIEVDGEEDLAPLLLHSLAPLDSVVLYGQPGKGVVVRRCSEEAKQRCRRLLRGFRPAD